MNEFIVKRFVDLYIDKGKYAAAAFIIQHVPFKEMKAYQPFIKEEFENRGWEFPED